MEILSNNQGVLKMMVASGGQHIMSGTSVIVEAVADNFGILSVFVTSVASTVQLPYFDTEIGDLIDL